MRRFMGIASMVGLLTFSFPALAQPDGVPGGPPSETPVGRPDDTPSPATPPPMAHSAGLLASPGAKDCESIRGDFEITESDDESIVGELDGDLPATFTMSIVTTTSIGPVVTFHVVRGTIAADGGDITTMGVLLSLSLPNGKTKILSHQVITGGADDNDGISGRLIISPRGGDALRYHAVLCFPGEGDGDDGDGDGEKGKGGD